MKAKDGSETTTTKIVEDNDLAKKTLDTKASESEKIVEKSSGVLSLSLLGGIDIHDPTPTYGISVTRSVIGPVTIGLWGLNNGTVGGSIGVNF